MMLLLSPYIAYETWKNRWFWRKNKMASSCKEVGFVIIFFYFIFNNRRHLQLPNTMHKLP